MVFTRKSNSMLRKVLSFKENCAFRKTHLYLKAMVTSSRNFIELCRKGTQYTQVYRKVYTHVTSTINGIMESSHVKITWFDACASLSYVCGCRPRHYFAVVLTILSLNRRFFSSDQTFLHFGCSTLQLSIPK